LTLNYEVTPWLTAMGRLGLDFNIDQFETKNDATDLLGIENGFYSNELLRENVNNSEFLLTAFKDQIFDSKFDLKWSVGASRWSRSLYGLKGQSGEWANPKLFAFNNFSDELSVPIPTEQRYGKKINSIYSFLNIGFSNYLFLELTARNDWSSALPLNNNAYFYPAASVSWIVTESLGNNWGPINFLKLRGAVAQTGSDTDPYQLDFVYDNGSFGNAQSTSLPETIPAIELKPQRANSYEIGVSGGVWDDRLNFDFTYYSINSYDQILEAPLPLSSGAPNFVTNAGQLRNRGWEASLSYDIWTGRKGFIRTSFNINRNRNYVVDLGGGAELLELANIWGLNGPAIAVEAGQEYGTIVGYDYVYHENGQRILNEEGTHYAISENRVPIGNASPDFVGGWNTEISFKGIRLAWLVDAKIGGDVYAGSYVIGLQTGQSPETLLEREGGGLPYTDPDEITSNIGVILEGVYEDGTPNDKVVHHYFKYLPNAGGWGRFLSTPGILDNTWVKMREISLAYELPFQVTKKLKAFQKLELALVGRDLFYLYTSLPDNINPEGANGSGNAQGLEWASYPGMRAFSFRIQANF